ncbi:MAG: hypothetical protein ISP45_12855 [Reyranella sp.]|nr:hypothetical protein [Reyranella sp.]
MYLIDDEVFDAASVVSTAILGDRQSPTRPQGDYADSAAEYAGGHRVICGDETRRCLPLLAIVAIMSI